jgi:hypothetical protein
VKISNVLNTEIPNALIFSTPQYIVVFAKCGICVFMFFFFAKECFHVLIGGFSETADLKYSTFKNRISALGHVVMP